MEELPAFFFSDQRPGSISGTKATLFFTGMPLSVHASVTKSKFYMRFSLFFSLFSLFFSLFVEKGLCIEIVIHYHAASIVLEKTFLFLIRTRYYTSSSGFFISFFFKSSVSGMACLKSCLWNCYIYFICKDFLKRYFGVHIWLTIEFMYLMSNSSLKGQTFLTTWKGCDGYFKPTNLATC